MGRSRCHGRICGRREQGNCSATRRSSTEEPGLSSISPLPRTSLPRSFPASLSSPPVHLPWTPPRLGPSSVATCGRRPTVEELTQPDCFSLQGPTRTDWCPILCVPSVQSSPEKDWLDVHLHLPGGGRLQRPHRGGDCPGRTSDHRSQRNCLWGLDGTYVGCMVGKPLFWEFKPYFILGMAT